jgi:hypothetical protein
MWLQSIFSSANQIDVKFFLSAYYFWYSMWKYCRSPIRRGIYYMSFFELVVLTFFLYTIFSVSFGKSERTYCNLHRHVISKHKISTLPQFFIMPLFFVLLILRRRSFDDRSYRAWWALRARNLFVGRPDRASAWWSAHYDDGRGKKRESHYDDGEGKKKGISLWWWAPPRKGGTPIILIRVMLVSLWWWAQPPLTETPAPYGVGGVRP